MDADILGRVVGNAERCDERVEGGECAGLDGLRLSHGGGESESRMRVRGGGEDK
jgi:hypothetical protein